MTMESRFPMSGRFFLSATALALMAAGAIALLLGAVGRFLPHDERFLGMTARDLCAMHECRIVHFMIHDRVSFGGSLIAIGLLYQWLTSSPLRRGQAWAWWLLVVSGTVGFASFFAYLGYGYLDTWHGLATLGLLPCFVIGIAQSKSTLPRREPVRCLLQPAVDWPWRTGPGIGRACLLATAIGMIFGGFTIFVVGMTSVFVPQDLAYMGVDVEELRRINQRLIPLIAHDRAGFGGGVCCCGVAHFFVVWRGFPSANLWRVLALVGLVGFGTAIGIHPAIGYNDAFHLAPAVVGACLHLTGLILTRRSMFGAKEPS